MLRNLNCRLKKFSLISYCVKDAVAISLANALCSSNTLKELHIVGINTITIAGRWHLSAGHFQKPTGTLEYDTQ